MATEQWLTMSEVARRLDIGLERAFDLIFSGQLDGEPHDGRVQVPEAALRRYEAQHAPAAQ